ncbi:ribosomal-protein-serine acetyltransferase [Vibrio sp. HA2012]|uniref:GNAT family N-acetyltransferase n=1 Tax=Vibrio sp. HA2012 TaxID=1971595 RepID=UPI000C2C9A76|nr:GNAT family protein [Vibrio sp. HA2012]PJC88126.1 ribosomal-protein-serine acetyltransferase [Vibrio sp. HA2012]
MRTHFAIYTQKLTLRLPSIEEASLLAEIISVSPTLHHWLDWCSPTFSTSDAEEFLSANQLNWIKDLSYGFGIYRKTDEALIGMVAVSEFYRSFNMASIGYWVADPHQKHGYGKEALDALIEFCFAQLNLTRLEIVCDPENNQSHRLAVKCGAVQESIARNRFIFHGKPRDGIVLSVIPQDTIK